MSDVIKTVGQTFSTDDIGVTTFTSKYYVASKDDYHRAGAAAPFGGLVETNRQGTDQKGMGEDGGKEGMIVTVTYEGILDGEEARFAGINNARIEFDASYGEEPIEAHPNILGIRANFGGTYDEEKDKMVFPPTVTDIVGPGSLKDTFGLEAAGVAFNGTQEVKNPLFGEETFLSLAAVFRRTYAVTKIPNDIINLIGTVYAKLPDEFRNLDLPSGKRNWMQQPFKLNRRGGAYVITDEWLQSPIGGWNEALYRALQVKTR